MVRFTGSVFAPRVLRGFMLATLASLLASPVLAQKTDLIHLRNGNIIVGEVKKLERGILRYSVDDIVGQLSIKWEYVQRLTSDQHLDVELRNGTVYFGPLIESPAASVLRVQTPDGAIDVAIANVVIIEPIKDTFWKRIDGNVSTGLSYTKASDVLQFSLGGSARYRRLEALTEVNLNTIVTSQASDEIARTNTDFRLTHFRFSANKWFYLGGGGLTRNDELGIDLRADLAGGGGRRLIQSNRMVLQLAALLSGNRELTSDGRRTDNLEAAIGTRWTAFRYDTPKLDVDTDATLFINLTTSGRYRFNFNGRVSLELGVEDLFWDLGQLYYRFDTNPSLTAASGNDYGIVTGFRYKF